MSRKLLLTGASGNLGRRVVELLLESGDDHVIAATRTPDKLASWKARGVELRAADFDRPESLDSAFAGVERLLLISTDALDAPGHRLAQHKNAIAAAKRAGVRHIVYTSLTNPGPESKISIAVDHRETERALAESGIEHTSLRNNMYTDYLLPGLAHAVEIGQRFAAIGDGKISYVTREDCARIAAAALSARTAGSRTLDVTGPSAVSQAEVATAAAEATGRPVHYVPTNAAQQEAGLTAAGLPAPVASLLVSFDLAAAEGQLAVVSDAVESLTGRAPMSVQAFLRANRAALVGQSQSSPQ